MLRGSHNPLQIGSIPISAISKLKEFNGDEDE